MDPALIDWSSSQSLLFANPSFSKAVLDRAAILPTLLPGHLWFTTSGSTAASDEQVRWVALSKDAFLASAHAVNAHLKITETDVWLNPLPSFHVGGMGIWARAHLLGLQVYPLGLKKWNAQTFLSTLKETQATLTSVVPTQLFDLVQQGCSAPPSLRGVIIGGGALSPTLYEQAQSLGWLALPSYGMTEASSQIATATNTADLVPLPHMNLRVNTHGLLEIQSKSLFTCFAEWDGNEWQLNDPKIDGWWTGNDRVKLDKGVLEVLGREDDLVKVGGELVSMKTLNDVCESIRLKNGFSGEAAVLAVPDERLGMAIHLATTALPGEAVQQFVDAFRCQVMPYEKIRRVHHVDSFPRTPLGKVRKKQLLDQLSFV